MKRSGEVTAEIGGVYVVKCSELDIHDLGKSIYNSDMKNIGKFVDIIGRVNSPYGVVEKNNTHIEVGDDIYL